MIHDPSLRKECSLSLVDSPKTVVEISSCGQEETPSNPFLSIRDSLQTNGHWLPLSYISNEDLLKGKANLNKAHSSSSGTWSLCLF